MRDGKTREGIWWNQMLQGATRGGGYWSEKKRMNVGVVNGDVRVGVAEFGETVEMADGPWSGSV